VKTNNGGGGGTPDSMDMNIQFQRGSSNSSPTSGEPARLIWEVPTQTRELSAPFEFVNLPLP